MNFKINNKDVKLKFGLKFCRSLDEVYKVDYQGLEFGMGVNFAYMNLEQRNPVAIAEIIKAASAHVGFSSDEIDEAVEHYAEENDGLEKLFTNLIHEMGKSQVVASTIKHFQENAKVTK
ncbi:tail assembly chaperone [Ornithinibacillus sp. BX22]|uniref:Tail assembly chaperone n=2 Tax=Ornithinibacillus TaxID=484508 RepID=A0A923RK15_9BACI|nr:tail assembly chaperone [Ornithinibacillus hominis]MBS3681783.1 tail assembly chaperone [Ornithinibacillus massiliensis]